MKTRDQAREAVEWAEQQLVERVVAYEHPTAIGLGSLVFDLRLAVVHARKELVEVEERLAEEARRRSGLEPEERELVEWSLRKAHDQLVIEYDRARQAHGEEKAGRMYLARLQQIRNLVERITGESFS